MNTCNYCHKQKSSDELVPLGLSVTATKGVKVKDQFICAPGCGCQADYVGTPAEWLMSCVVLVMPFVIFFGIIIAFAYWVFSNLDLSGVAW